MKNSAWYQKLWRKKLNELLVQEDIESSWANMKKILDEQLPEKDIESGSSSRPLGVSLVFLLKYLIPVIVIIGLISYFYVPQYTKPQNFQNQKTKQKEFLDTLKHEPINIDHIQNNRKDTKELPVTGNTFAHSSNSTGYFNKENNIISKEETAISNSEDRIKTLKYNNKLHPVKSPKKTTFVSSKSSLPSAAIKNSNDFHEISMVKTVLNENKNPAQLNRGKRMDSVSKISSENSYLDGKNEVVQSNNITDQFIAQTSTSGFTKSNLPKQVPAIVTTGKIGSGKPDGLALKNTAKVKKASIFITPPYNYGLEIGINTANKVNFYFGVFGSYAMSKRVLVNTGVRINSYRQIFGEYSHPSYYRPDSLPPFKIIDSRKLLTTDILINLEYRISKTISVKAGPVINLLLKQASMSSKLAPIADLRDTVYHSKEINKAIGNTVINKATIGFIAGVIFRVKKFDLNSSYQLFTPHKVNNDLGSYRKTYHTVQFGIGYRFK